MASGLGATALAWIGTIAGASHGTAARRALELAAHAPDRPGRLLVLPDLAGGGATLPDAEVRGVVAGLDLATGPEELALAVLEGIALRVAEQLDRLAEAGLPCGEVRVTGGAARDERWLRLRADVTGRTVRRVVPADAGTTAAVALAAVAGGLAPTIDEVVAAVVRLGRPIEPRPDRHAAFLDLAERRQALRVALAAAGSGAGA
jgi:sugar (pentulose or hexulose) kinase